MFARKKTADVQTSLQRFCDLHRDAASRAKHFKLAIEMLAPQEKRQLVDDFNFEIFHLIDALLLHPDLSVDAQIVFDAESALWTLEQLLCYAPELVGKGWQRNAIEAILKRALLPRNLLAVRKIAIRLFLIWYQTLAVYNNAQALDVVFQCCLPFFPLRSRQQTEKILQIYCETPSGQFFSNGFHRDAGGFEPGPVRTMPIIVDGGATTAVPGSGGTATSSTSISDGMGVRERAQTLQIYLDKFLEYCCRETMKIEWGDEVKRVACVKFILDRVIVLYISETFPDIEKDGVDVFGGWEGSEEPAQLLDTADPIVIARYWLIRWMTNIALSSLTNQASSPGLVLFREVLLSSQKATNSMLTLLREAMQLPLACSNVIHKVLSLVRCWLLQREIPPFVDSGLVGLEAWNVLLIHTMISFFKSPYLRSSGERLPAAVSLTHSILAAIRELANPATSVLPRALPVSVWSELLRCLSEAALLYAARSDAYSSAAAAAFTRTLLSVAVYVWVIREVPLPDRIWDDVWRVFRVGIWTQVVDQWSKVVEIMTRALILNLFAIDLNNLDGGGANGGESSNETSHLSARRLVNTARSSIIDRGNENGSIVGDNGIGGGCSALDENRSQHGSDGGGGSSNAVVADNERDIEGIVQSTGNGYLWLRSWMRVVYLVDPNPSPVDDYDHPHNNTNTEEDDGALIGGGGGMCIAAGQLGQQRAVQTLSRAMDALRRVGCANVLVHWLAARLLQPGSHNEPGRGCVAVEQPHAIAPLCMLLTRCCQPLPDLHRAYILYNLSLGLRGGSPTNLHIEKSSGISVSSNRHTSTDSCESSELNDDVAQLVLEQIPQMGMEELTVLSADTIATLQRLIRKSEFSGRAVRVAALLALNHSEAEKILISLFENSSIEAELDSLILSINSLSIVILERADERLFFRMAILIANHRRGRQLLPLFCSNLVFLTKVGLCSSLSDLFLRTIVNGNGSCNQMEIRHINDLKWQLCALSAREKTCKRWRPFIDCLHASQDSFLEGMLCQLTLQYPLPGFSVTQWNSLSSTAATVAADQNTTDGKPSATFINADAAILSFDKSEKNTFLWSRTPLGRHCYTVGVLDAEKEPEPEVNAWLESLAQGFPPSAADNNRNLNRTTSAESGGGATDPFQELPRPVPRWNGSAERSSRDVGLSRSASSVGGGGGDVSPTISSQQQTAADVADMLAAIRASVIRPQQLPSNRWNRQFLATSSPLLAKHDGSIQEDADSSDINDQLPPMTQWRKFLTDFRLLERVRDVPVNFHRELRHLDSTMSREVHKVAVIFVSKNQEDKQSILSNTVHSTSAAFNAFVDGLGWVVQVGSPSFCGYAGGLPAGQLTPYYASANTELVFHVSTMLNGDATQKLKHLGNDEVHVVWSEHLRPYKRELIATRFCDVLIVLYPVTAVLVRVHVETQDHQLRFGPLFDGAYVHVKQVASLTRETVLNASRAYRNARVDCDRPNKHREKVFEQTKTHLKHLPLAESIVRLYAPISNC